MINLDTIANELFNKIRGRFPSVTVGNESAEITNSVKDARFFEFDFVPGKKVSINLDTKSLTIMYSKNLFNEREEVLKSKWFDFLKEVRAFAKKRMLNFDTRDITKSNLDKRDYEYLSTEKQMSESKLYGTSRTSFQNIGTARMVVKHSAPINQESATGRNSNIAGIYIESSEGERFKYPFKHLNGARAMAQHVSEGGTPFDDFGKHVTSLSEEMNKLRKFKTYMNRSSVMAEGLAGYMDVVNDRLATVKKTIENIQKPAKYKEMSENFTSPVLEDVPEDIATDWTAQLTIKQFNEELKGVFPYIYKLVSEANAVKELGPEELLGEEIREGHGDTATSVAKELKKMGVSADAHEDEIIKMIPDALKSLGLEGVLRQMNMSKGYQQDMLSDILDAISGVSEADEERKPVRYDPKSKMPFIMKYAYQPDVTRALRKAAGLSDDAPVYFDDVDLVYGHETVIRNCSTDDECTFGDAVKALKVFAKKNPISNEMAGSEYHCKYCGDTMHNPTTNCQYDVHDENGDNWVDDNGNGIHDADESLDPEVSYETHLDNIIKNAKHEQEPEEEQLTSEEQAFEDFKMAAANAAAKGEKEFEYPKGSGKKHPTKMDKSTAAKLLADSQNQDIEEQQIQENLIKNILGGAAKMLPKLGSSAKPGLDALVKAAPTVGKGASVAGKGIGTSMVQNPLKWMTGLGLYSAWNKIPSLEDLKNMMPSLPNLEEIAGIAKQYALPAAVVIAVLYGGKKLIDKAFDDKDDQQVVADSQTNEGSNKQAQIEVQDWFEKFNEYKGTNGDDLAQGWIRATLDTGIMADAYEEDEVLKFNKMKGYPTDELDTNWQQGDYADFTSNKSGVSPITAGMFSTINAIMKKYDLDEEDIDDMSKADDPSYGKPDMRDNETTIDISPKGNDTEMDKKDNIPLDEFIKSMYDYTQNSFPKGETAVMTAVQKKYGDEVIDEAQSVMLELLKGQDEEMARIQQLAGIR